MSSFDASRKRKASAIDTDVHNIEAPLADVSTKKTAMRASNARIPAPCIAKILNFMWYADVRQCMLAGKMMTKEVAQHVETLNITKTSELIAPSARRFRNASEVNILCLVSEYEMEDNDNEWITTHRLSLDTTLQVVPFLSTFPKIKHAYFGGLASRRSQRGNTVWSRIEYDPFEESETDWTIRMDGFKALIQNLVGAFRAKTLPQTLKISGVTEQRRLYCQSALTPIIERTMMPVPPAHPCLLCPRVLSSFPLNFLWNPGWVPITSTFCVPVGERVQAILRREGAEDVLRSNDGTHTLLTCLRNSLPSDVRWISSEDEADQAFLKTITDQGGATRTEGGEIEIPDGVIEMIPMWAGATDTTEFSDVVKGSPLLQDIVKGIPSSQLVQGLKTVQSLEGRDSKPVFARDVFAALVEDGWNLREDDCVIVDKPHKYR